MNSIPFSDSEFGMVGGNEPIPETEPEGGAQEPFTGPDQHAADGYIVNGPDSPQVDSGPGAPSVSFTGAQTGADSEGYTEDLTSYSDNAISLDGVELDDFEQAYAAGQAQADIQDIDQLNRAAYDYALQAGKLDPVEQDILAEMFMAGIEGVGNEQ